MQKRFNDDNEQQDNILADDPRGRDPDLEPDLEKVEAGGDLESVIEKLQAQIIAKNKEIAELNDRYLRTLAESENVRKRIRQQSEETTRLQRENLLRELLPVIDNLERAVEAARGGGNGTPIVEGVEMVLRSMLDFLKTHGVTQLTAVGERFDPQRHEAVDQIESTAHAPNTVVNEYHRGYQIGDRLLRPARVAVARGPNERGRGGENGPRNDDVESG
jgi:molecular chaperone GrpE